MYSAPHLVCTRHNVNFHVQSFNNNICLLASFLIKYETSFLIIPRGHFSEYSLHYLVWTGLNTAVLIFLKGQSLSLWIIFIPYCKCFCSSSKCKLYILDPFTFNSFYLLKETTTMLGKSALLWGITRYSGQ